MTAGALMVGDRLGDVAPDDPGFAVAERRRSCRWLTRRHRPAAGCASLSASTVTIPVATIAIRTPTAAATPDSASHRCLGGLIGCGKPLGRNGPARCTTSSRYDCASGPASAHSPSTSSRSTCGSGGQRGHAVQRRRPQRAVLAVGADVALVDVAADPLARQHGHPAVPVVEQHVELRASPAPGAGHEQDAERLLQLAAGARRQGVRLVPRHAEHGRQVGAVQVVPEVELDDLALARVQPVEGGPDEPAQFGPLRAVIGVGRRVGQCRRPHRGRPRSRAAGGDTRCGLPRRARAAACAGHAGRRAWRRR